MTHDPTASGRLSGSHLVGVEVLVLDGDARVHAGVAQLLSEVQLHVTCVSVPEDALALVEHQFFSVALIDIDTPEPRAGIATIRTLKAASPTSMVIAMTPRRSYDDAVDAVRAGAIDLILKAPESVAYLKDRVLAAAGRSVGKREVDSVLDDVRGVHEEFLQRFMEAERRAIDLADKAAGRDPSRTDLMHELRVLVIDQVDDFVAAIAAAAPDGFVFVHATSGGEGLDRISSGGFHYAMVAEDVTDLPARTLARTIRNQHPDTVVLTFWVTGIVFITVNLFLAWVVWRYRHRQNQVATYDPENKKLEWWLTIVTAVGVAAMLAPGLFVWHQFVTVPEGASEVEVIGQQWQWSFRLPGQDGRLGTSDARAAVRSQGRARR